MTKAITLHKPAPIERPVNAGLQLATMTEAERAQANHVAFKAQYKPSTRAMIESITRLYLDWCQRSGNQPYRLDRAQLLAFFTDNPAARKTQQARKSHLKAMLTEYTRQNPDNLEAADALAMLSTFKLPPMPMPKSETDPKSTDTADDEAARIARIARDAYKPQQKRRTRQALSGDMVWAVMSRTWNNDIEAARNRAILALAFYCAMRRQEIAKLEWKHVNLSEGYISIIGGKHREGNKVDKIALLGNSADLLKAWEVIALANGNREYVFCPLSKAGKLLKDKGLSGEAIRLIAADAGGFMPHDARRTFATRGLESGTPLNAIQGQMRHINPSTTMGYAEYLQMKEIRESVKLPY